MPSLLNLSNRKACFPISTNFGITFSENQHATYNKWVSVFVCLYTKDSQISRPSTKIYGLPVPAAAASANVFSLCTLKMLDSSSTSDSYRNATRMSGTFVRVISFPATPSRV